MDVSITPGIWKHFKGPLYYVTGNITIDCDTQQPIVEYVALYDDCKKCSQPLQRFIEIIETCLLSDDTVISSINLKPDQIELGRRLEPRFVLVSIKKSDITHLPYVPVFTTIGYKNTIFNLKLR